MFCSIERGKIMQDNFESKLKEEFEKLGMDYDGLQIVLANVKDHHVCDCDNKRSADCRYPDKYKDGKCK